MCIINKPPSTVFIVGFYFRVSMIDFESLRLDESRMVFETLIENYFNSLGCKIIFVLVLEMCNLVLLSMDKFVKSKLC